MQSTSNNETRANLHATDNGIKFNSIESFIESHLERPEWKDLIHEKHNQLTKTGYVKVSDLLPPSVMEEVQRESREIVRLSAKPIDIKVKVTSDSPRKLNSVNFRDIMQHGNILPCLYGSESLRRGLNSITRHDVVNCEWENERMTMTFQNTPGHTHGWHWGDYQYALIFIVDHPPIENGGMLQCVPHTTWDKSNPNIFKILCENQIDTYFHEAGDIYFFRTDTTLHRTYPLEKEGARIILNFTYDGPDGVGKERTHETQDALYDQES